ncbi:hypothetical protein DFJ67_3510 [Asanoa ferruginea]|uniref:Uncharacterized protein n=1 Tax=Asanoa ferruginea TaxID=53367 RepID=A0A3D9ZKX4_9ACTN|nr:hypothetical protein DFJ67_3510 [Asanoa ferruginea]
MESTDHDGRVTAKQRWVIIIVCAATAVTLAVLAIVVGSRGVEVFSWFAGIASLLVAVLTQVLARRGPSIDPTPATSIAPQSSPSTSTAVHASQLDPPPTGPSEPSADSGVGSIDVRHAHGMQINQTGGNNQHNTFGRREDRP